HTWIEFANRLLAPTSGVPAAIMLFLSFLLWRKSGRRDLFLFSLGVILFMGFEAWLGKIVVEGNLVPGHITMHMFGTFIILAFLLMNIFRSRREQSLIAVDSRFRLVIILTLVLLMLQTFMGTQVREDVDALLSAEVARNLLIDNVSFWFYIHRTFSLVLLGLVGWIFWKNATQYRLKSVQLLAIFVLLEILVGVVLVYGNMPAWMQPVHLWLTVGMFCVLVWQILQTRGNRATLANS
ncbi:MAG: hypothetical protein HKN32_03815, partial [Flavobacteriales bacterium]|nr:hypothetical protein [Flavobacteriales bacterium]